ncbi:uncharacterized protein [Engystomops pustulosus]|uniref:uncharacterized protein isoform X2 n=1 Tax=Engystomops pustulosus TaxID=76066 RepID=UPI003AFAC20E
MDLLQENEDPSTTAVDFLDLKISIENNHLCTDLHRKDTATNSLLHFQSFHPKHLKTGIPVGQFIRLRRNCTLDDNFKSNALDLTSRFRNRQYPKRVISQAYQRARNSSRSDLLTPKKARTPPQLGIYTMYNNQWGDIWKILNKNWYILNTESRLQPFIDKKPKLVAKRARNLKDQLMKSHFVRPSKPLGRGLRLQGSFPCGDCSVCPLLRPTKEFTNPLDQKRFFLPNYINCKSKNIIYALICPCQKVYVGQTTQELRKRVQQHISSINNAHVHFSQGKHLSSVAAHFRSQHGGKCRGLQVVGLNKTRPNARGGNITPELLRCEAQWIFRLNCLSPQGLNEELLFTGFYKQR